MQKVQEKVNRSISLITNLGSERERWDNSSNEFKNQMSTMVGDVLLSASFLGYIGYFDHFYRKMLTNQWRE
jgi:dynein heavy chain 1